MLGGTTSSNVKMKGSGMDNPFTSPPPLQYAGIIRTPDEWLLTKSKQVYDFFDLPGGLMRDMILSVAEDRGDLIHLGPATMTAEQAAAASARAFGKEMTPEEAAVEMAALVVRFQSLIDEEDE